MISDTCFISVTLSDTHCFAVQDALEVGTVAEGNSTNGTNGGSATAVNGSVGKGAGRFVAAAMSSSYVLTSSSHVLSIPMHCRFISVYSVY